MTSCIERLIRQKSQNIFIGFISRKYQFLEDTEMPLAELSNRFLKLLFLWVGVLNIPQVSNLQNFVQLCSSF
jgi:hypothetical protein